MCNNVLLIQNGGGGKLWQSKAIRQSFTYPNLYLKLQVDYEYREKFIPTNEH